MSVEIPPSSQIRRETPVQIFPPAHGVDEGNGVRRHVPRLTLRRAPGKLAPLCAPLASLPKTAAPELGTESVVEWGGSDAWSRGGHYTAFRTTTHSLLGWRRENRMDMGEGEALELGSGCLSVLTL